MTKNISLSFLLCVSLLEAKAFNLQTQEAFLNTPQTSYVFTSKDLQAFGTKTVAEILSFLPGVQFVDTTGSGTEQRIGMRGIAYAFSSPSVLVFVDGVEQNIGTNSTHGHVISGTNTILWQSIPLEAIEKIEVQSGDASARYGGGATAGVIHITTKSPSEDLKANVRAGGGSYGENVQSGFVSGTQNGTGYSFFAKHYSHDGWRDTNDKSKIYNVYGKIARPLSERLEAELLADFSHWVNGLPGWFFVDQSIDAGGRGRVSFINTDARLKTDKVDTSLKLDYKINDNLTLSNRLSGQFVTQDLKNASRYVDKKVDFQKYADELKLSSKNELLGKTNNLNVGISGEYKKTKGKQIGSKFGNGATVMPGVFYGGADGKMTSYGFFIQDELKLTQKLNLFAGLRYDISRISAHNENEEVKIFKKNTKQDFDTDFSQVSYRLGASYLLGDDWSLFGNFRKGYEMTDWKSYNLFTNAVMYPDVKPTKVVSYELGSKAFLFDKRLFVQAVGYLSKLKDQINFNSFNNKSRSQMEGVELEAKYFATQNIFVFTTYTYNHSKNKSRVDIDGIEDGGFEWPFQPHNKITSGVFYKHISGFYGSLMGKWVDSYRIENSTAKSKSVTTFDAKLGFDKGKKFSFALSIRNLFDADYATSERYISERYHNGIYDSTPVRLARTPATPRTVYLEAAYNF